MYQTIGELRLILKEIKQAEETRIPREEFLKLITERSRLTQILKNRLWEINNTLNYAYKNKEAHLPYKAYKNLCNERQAIRDILLLCD